LGKFQEWMIPWTKVSWKLQCKMWLLPNTHVGHWNWIVKASLSMWLQTAKFIATKLKCAGLAQAIGFSAPNWCSLPWLVKGATQLGTSKKECNKLDLTAAQYFRLVDHNDWPRWFTISSPHVYAVPVTVLLVGLPK
jgi:hypothetical protein